MTLKEKIDAYLLENKKNCPTLKDLARKSGITYVTLHNWYTNDVNFTENRTIKEVRKLADTLGCTFDYLVDDSKNVEEKAISIPILGSIKAGVPIEAQTDLQGEVLIPYNWTRGNKKFFALRISGDSMSPNYKDKDIVVFEKNDDLEKQKGKDCAVILNNGDTTFKKIIVEDNSLILQPYNSQYTPLFFSAEEVVDKEVKIIGIARETRRTH